MMTSMPRPRPQYLHRNVDRHGNVRWYFRRYRKGPYVRIHGDYGSPEFKAAYDAALIASGCEKSQKPPDDSKDTLAWLTACYQDSGAWHSLAPETRRQRKSIYKRINLTAGKMPLHKITQEKIVEGLDRRHATPFAANDFLKAMRALFKWARKRKHVDHDPTKDVEGPSQRTDGYPCWTDEEIERFERHWPIGTKERLAFALLLFTGMRRGDVVTLGRQHIRDDTIIFRMEKTKKGYPAKSHTIPLEPELAAVIAASPAGDLAFLCGRDGRPMPKRTFSDWFAKARKMAGVPGSPHGLRKALATRLANNGATEDELKAYFGWSSSQMPALYTRPANQKKLAERAMDKLRNNRTKIRTSMPTPRPRTPTL